MQAKPDPRLLKARRALEEAVACQQQGRLAEAEKMYRRIVEKTPDYFDALHFYGLFKYQQGHMDDAVRLVAKATKINPRSVNALNSLGVILGAVGRHADAWRALMQPSRSSPIICRRCSSATAATR